MKPFIGELQSSLERLSCRSLDTSFNYRASHDPAAASLHTDVRGGSLSYRVQMKVSERLLDAVAISSF